MAVSEEHRDHRYAVIARSRMPDIAQFQTSRIRKNIQDQLGPYISSDQIAYRSPNFIIYLDDPHVQRNILSSGTINAAEFILDLQPWCRELELAQIPWIQDTASKERTVIIEPLTILPLQMKTNKYQGSHKLKDSYAAALGTNYELRAPDYSYLIITEIKDYYYAKHHLLTSCVQTTTHLASKVHCYSDRLSGILQQLVDIFQNLSTADGKECLTNFNRALIESQMVACDAVVASKDICSLASSLNIRCKERINLDGFRKIASFLETPVPDTYVQRLRIIHSATVKQVYRGEAFITAMSTVSGDFEAFLTIGKVTSKYRDKAFRTAATAEAAATYESLRYITNVSGYKIVDLNYHTLAQLTEALQSQNTNMVQLQCCVCDLMEFTEQLCLHFATLKHEFTSVATTLPQQSNLNQTMADIESQVNKYQSDTARLFSNFHNTKAKYFLESIDSQPANIKPSCWMRVQQPDTALNPP